MAQLGPINTLFRKDDNSKMVIIRSGELGLNVFTYRFIAQSGHINAPVPKGVNSQRLIMGSRELGPSVSHRVM